MTSLKSIFLSCALFCSAAAFAQDENPLWLRKSCISPDGKTIAFGYKGDIYTVAREGGIARQITSHEAHDDAPKWTADSKQIVFTSHREGMGSKDLYLTSAIGGKAKRLTDFPGSEILLTVTGEGKLIFSASIDNDKNYGGFPTYPKVYATDLNGGRPYRVSALPVGNFSINAQGQILYEDLKGPEDSFRKHHQSSITRDIWLYTPQVENKTGRIAMNETGSFVKLTDFQGEDRDPIWAADGKTYYYLSEQDGCLNIYRANIETTGKSEQLTFFKDNPVRYLSVSNENILCFSYNGELYTLDAKQKSAPQRVALTIISDNAENDVRLTLVSGGARSCAVSPDGKEVAVVTKGDVYVTAPEVSRTVRVTETPEQERGVSFSKDGKTLYYASERNGCWSIFKCTLADASDKYFSFTNNFKESRVTKEGECCFQPVVSPDGKWLAFLRNRTELVIKDCKSGKEKSLHKDINYSYKDGDQEFQWSPDSRYILCNWQKNGGWNNEDVALVDIESGEITNLTQSGYTDDRGHFALDGKAMTWRSDKAGYRSHGSWGAEKDIYIQFFDDKTYYEFIRSESHEEEEKFLKDGDKKAEKKEKKDSIKAEKVKFTPDLTRLDERIVRLTPYSGAIGDHYMTKDGKKLYFTMSSGKSVDLYVLDVKKKSLKVSNNGVSGLIIPSADEKYIYVMGGLGSISRIDVKSGAKKSISYKGWYSRNEVKEREYIFDHIWNQVQHKFYDKDFVGVDWKACYDNYRRFLPHINNNFDFTEMLSEMLGELNASHTGARYQTIVRYNVARLGVIFDDNYEGDGLKIAEIFPGSPLLISDPDIQVGDIITAVDGQEIKKEEAWYKHFIAKGKRDISVSVSKKGKKPVVVRLMALASEKDMLYRRWVRQREEMTAKLSGGKIGYVHIREMASASFREAYSKILGKYRDCDAVVVDTRYNGGGWLHDDLITLLGGEEYIQFVPRGQYIGKDPYNKWTKPSCVLVCEANYSDASIFPYIYQSLGIGKLVGTPVAGTGTAVWWETQVDESLVFGIPEVTSIGTKEGKVLENLQIEPDILVYNDPASILRGEDKQLEAAVKHLMELKK